MEETKVAEIAVSAGGVRPPMEKLTVLSLEKNWYFFMAVRDRTAETLFEQLANIDMIDI